MPYDPARHGAYVDAYGHHKQQNPQRANDWIDKLKREFYDRGNSVGTDALYSAIQKRHPAPNAYPTKRFVRAWLRRQATIQVHQRPQRKKTDIQAIITSKPNELLCLSSLGCGPVILRGGPFCPIWAIPPGPPGPLSARSAPIGTLVPSSPQMVVNRSRSTAHQSSAQRSWPTPSRRRRTRTCQ